MRTVSATLATLQKATTRTPYILLTFTNGATTYTYTTADNRILYIDHLEETYSHTARIVLRNNTRDLPDLRGFKCTIDYGLSSGGNNYVPTPNGPAPLWVHFQPHISKAGKVYAVLILAGVWERLGETNEFPGMSPVPVYPWWTIDFTGTAHTPYGIIEHILDGFGFDLEALGIHDDSIINTIVPDFIVNVAGYETPRDVVYRLVNMTKSFLRAERCSTGAHTADFRVIYPVAWTSYHAIYTSDRPDATYHQFKDFQWSDHMFIPNKVKVGAGENDAGDFTIEGTYTLDDSYNNEYGDVVKYGLGATLGTQPLADDRAKVIARRLWMEAPLGRGRVPHDCGVEQYDYVQFRDKRGVADYVDYPTARWNSDVPDMPKLCVVGSLEHIYSPYEGVYDLIITLNGISSAPPVYEVASPKTKVIEPPANVIPETAPAIKPFKPILDPAHYGGAPAVWDAAIDLGTGGARIRKDLAAQAIRWGQEQARKAEKRKLLGEYDSFEDLYHSVFPKEPLDEEGDGN